MSDEEQIKHLKEGEHVIIDTPIGSVEVSVIIDGSEIVICSVLSIVDMYKDDGKNHYLFRK